MPIGQAARRGIRGIIVAAPGRFRDQRGEGAVARSRRRPFAGQTDRMVWGPKATRKTGAVAMIAFFRGTSATWGGRLPRVPRTCRKGELGKSGRPNPVKVIRPRVVFGFRLMYSTSRARA